jgi:hypothetical protein
VGSWGDDGGRGGTEVDSADEVGTARSDTGRVISGGFLLGISIFVPSGP